MSPIVQTLANSSAYGYRAFTAAGGDYESIATANFTSNTSAISFTSIPSTYQHLQVRFMVKSQSASNDFSFWLNNVSSGSSYAFHNLAGNGSSASANAYTSQSFMQLTNDFFSGFPSGSVMSGVIDLLDYKDTNKNRTVRTLLGTDQNGAGFVKLNSGLYQSTTAVSQIDFFNGYNWGSGSFALYGIKG